MNELVANPFAQDRSVLADTAGAKQSQHREMAETQAMVAMAKRFPRDERAAVDRIINSFTRASLAEDAQYQFSRGGSDIAGPSIRAAEAIAQQWGNLSFGFRELSRGIGPDGVGFSEVEAFAWDMESNSRRPAQFIVRHWRDTKGGGYKLKDERDIYELTANQAQRRVRACILALVPGDVTEAAMKQAETTLKAKADTSPEAMKKLLETFAQFNVTKEMIEKRIQRRMDAIQPAQVVSLRRIFTSLRDGMSAAEDWFEAGEEQRGTSGIEATRAAAKEAAAKAQKATGSDEPTLPTYAQFVEALNRMTDPAAVEAHAQMIVRYPKDQAAELDRLVGAKLADLKKSTKN